MTSLGLSRKASEPFPWGRSAFHHSTVTEAYWDHRHLNVGNPKSSSLFSGFLMTDSGEQQQWACCMLFSFITVESDIMRHQKSHYKMFPTASGYPEHVQSLKKNLMLGCTRNCKSVSTGDAGEWQVKSQCITGSFSSFSPLHYLKYALDMLPLRVVTLSAFFNTMRITDKLKQFLSLLVWKNRIQNKIFVCAQPLRFF